MFVGQLISKSLTPVALRSLSRGVALLLALALVSDARGAPEDRRSGPVAVSDGEHLWFFEASGLADNPRVVVLHHGPGHGPKEAEQASVTEDMPEAALAVDGRLYCIFRGKRDPDGGYSNRSVSMVRAEAFDTRARVWVYEPSPRGRTVADLPGAGRVTGVAADGRDPLVLLTPLPKLIEPDDSSPSAPGGAEAPAPTLPRLYRLTLDGWQVIALPDAIKLDDQLALIAGVPPMLVASAVDSADGESIACVLDADGAWTTFAVDLDVSRIIDSAVHDGQTYLALRSPRETTIEIVLLRTPHVYPVMRVEQPATDIRLIEFNSSLAIAAASPEGDRLSVMLVDVENGKVESTVELQQRLRPALQDFSLLVLVAALLFASLIMFIFRPADPTRMTVTLPKGARIAEPRRRIVALLIDLLPSALLSGLILDVPFSQVVDITHMPMRAHHIEQSWPMILMFVICIGHGTLSELVWGRTLGKTLLDCWVVGIDGKRASVTAILVRNAMKFVALNVPLLFLFVYINQYRQRLGDLAGRTIVVTHHDGIEPSDASIDRDA